MIAVEPELPFTLNDVRIAARKMLDVKLLPEAIETELRKAANGYADALRSFERAHRSGTGRRQRLFFRRLEASPAARLISFVLANGKRGAWKVRSWDAISRTSRGVALRSTTGELVRANEKPKRSGGIRWTCAFGPKARAAQRMVGDIIYVVAGPSRYEHARMGRGRETATRETLKAIRQKGVRWFGVMDVKDFFPSITREMVKDALSFLPEAVINATIFTHEDTDIQLRGLHRDTNKHRSEIAIRKGIPQGSLASSIVAGKLLEQHLDKLDARHILAHVDNVLIGGKTADEVQSHIIALGSSLEDHPSGSLRLTGKVHQLGDPMLDYLGYRFKRRSMHFGGFGQAMFSERSRTRLHTRIAQKILLVSSKHRELAIDAECSRWVRSFPCWETRHRNEDIAAIEAYENLLPLVDAAHRAIRFSKMSWKDWKGLGQFLEKLARRIGEGVPRLTTVGGPPSFEALDPAQSPWQHFEAYLTQNAKKHVLAIG